MSELYANCTETMKKKYIITFFLPVNVNGFMCFELQKNQRF